MYMLALNSCCVYLSCVFTFFTSWYIYLPRSLQCDVESFRPDSPIYYDATGTLDWAELLVIFYILFYFITVAFSRNANSEKEAFKKLIVQKLREVKIWNECRELFIISPSLLT